MRKLRRSIQTCPISVTRIRRSKWSSARNYVERLVQKERFGHFRPPDIAFISKKVVVFCDSEFWHGYDWEHRKDDIKTNREFWIPKIERNIQRDIEVNETLREQGWTVLRFWGKDIEKNLSDCADKIERTVREK